MSGHSSRKSGVLSAALLNGQHAEIICDGYHVSEQAIKMLKNVFLSCILFLTLFQQLDYLMVNITLLE